MVREALGVGGPPRRGRRGDLREDQGQPTLPRGGRPLAAGARRARADPGASSVTRAAELAALEIPDRVQGLLMSRIDRLPPDTREVLKAGSVVGRSFDEKVLGGDRRSTPAAGPPGPGVRRAIGGGAGRSAAKRRCALVTFRHALVQDVAYESMPFARRRELHGARRALPRSRPRRLPTTACSSITTGEQATREKTRLHAVRASESSVAVYANPEAVDYLASRSRRSEGGPSATPACAAGSRSSWATAWRRSPGTTRRSVRFSRARRRWASPAVRQVRRECFVSCRRSTTPTRRDSLLCWKIAVSVERGRSAYSRALRWLERGAATLPPDRPGSAARMLVAKCGFLSRLGRFREALGFGDEGVALARQDGDAGLQAYALACSVWLRRSGSPGAGHRVRRRGRRRSTSRPVICVVWR